MAISVVDGYNNTKLLEGNYSGRRAANFIAEKYLQKFQQLNIEDIQKKAEKTKELTVF